MIRGHCEACKETVPVGVTYGYSQVGGSLYCLPCLEGAHEWPGLTAAFIVEQTDGSTALMPGDA